MCGVAVANGMKTLLWSITNFHGGSAAAAAGMIAPPPPKGFLEGELRRASGFIANGVKCLALYQVGPHREFLPCHPLHSRPSLLDLNCVK
jgi:hypothetical protein